MSHPELAAEQAHVDHAYEQLEAMRANALGMLRSAFGERGGTFQALTERDIRVRTSLNRLEQLQLGRESLVFGRIDRMGPEPDVPREDFHIGRLAVADKDQEPLVVDWRAPVAEPFYRATGAQPMGLTRRRHFMTEGRRVVDLEDELFADPSAPDLDDDALADGGDDGDGRRSLGTAGLGAGLSGSATLLAALERTRTGRMRDIVATVQREQDEIIRSPLSGILVVQGGPGTGKTAVALHRAAYLLYTYRFPLESQGVLVVGPNPLFLRYIEHVLPSLGESGVEMSTVGGLYGSIRATGVDQPAAERLKGDARMARFLVRAVADRERPLRRRVDIAYGHTLLALTAEASAEIVASARRRAGSHNGRRRFVETLVWRHLHARFLEAKARRGGVPAGYLAVGDEDSSWSAPPVDELTPAQLGADLRRMPVVVEALDRMWPLLSASELLRDLFGAAPLIELASRGLLSGHEQQLLLRPRSDSLETVDWTEADLPLLDEARSLLGSPRGNGNATGEGRDTDGRGAGAEGGRAVGRSMEGGDDEVSRAYGHVVVDEAQDLSPMQLRMLGRRSLSGSMTIVGDIAQATGEWAPAAWPDVLSHLPTRRGTRVVELTVNYRTPSEIMDLARRVLETAAPGMVAPESVRSTGVLPRLVGVDRTSLLDRVAAIAAEEAAIISGESASGGTVGVICPPSLLAGAAAALSGAGIDHGSALDETVTLVPLQGVKGLEFDSVIVVEPAAVVAESAQGLRALYVALTRATRRLSIVHAGELPVAVRD